MAKCKCNAMHFSLRESGRSVADNGRASGAGSLGGGGELKMMMTMICGDCQDAREGTLLHIEISLFVYLMRYDLGRL